MKTPLIKSPLASEASKIYFPFYTTNLSKLPFCLRKPVKEMIPYMERRVSQGISDLEDKRILITGKSGSGKTREAIRLIHKIHPSIIIYTNEGLQIPYILPKELEDEKEVVILIDDLPHQLEYSGAGARISTGFANVGERLERIVQFFEGVFPNLTIIITAHTDQIEILTQQLTAKRFLNTFSLIELPNLNKDESEKFLDVLINYYGIKMERSTRRKLILSNDGTLANLVRFFSELHRQGKEELNAKEVIDFQDFMRGGWNDIYFKSTFWERIVIETLSMFRQCLIAPFKYLVIEVAKSLSEGYILQKEHKIEIAIDNLSKSIINIVDNKLICYDLDLAKKGNVERHIKDIANAVLNSAKQHLIEDLYASLYNLGLKTYYSNNIEITQKIIELLVEVSPQNAELHYNYGYLLNRKGKINEAEKEFNKALALAENDSIVHRNYAIFLDGNKRYEEAETEYRTVIKLNQNDVDTHQLLADLLLRLRRLDEAEEEYRKALSMSPMNPEIHNNLGILLKRRGDMEGAETEYRFAIQLDPDYSKARLNLGTLLYIRGRITEAKQKYLETLKIDPYSIITYTNLGRLCSNMKQYKESEKAYKKALELDPENGKIWNLLGLLKKEMGKLDEALEAYYKAISINNNLIDAHYNLTMVYDAKGEPEKAIEHWEAIIESFTS